MTGRVDTGDRNAVPQTAALRLRAVHRRSAFADFGVENAAACINACFSSLVLNVEDACRRLQQPEYQRASLWDLYCCDSVNCGVYIGNVGQSPNVDLIINECQNIGFFSIEDPGPPVTNYCASFTPNPMETGSPPNTQAGNPLATSSELPWSIESAPSHTMPPAGVSETPALFSVTSVSPSGSTDTSSPSSTNTNTSRLTGGAKAAIGVFSVLAAVAIAVLLILLFRRRRASRRRNPPGPYKLPQAKWSYPGLRRGSQTQLISPPTAASSRNIPLTPPAKLSDRRFLNTALRDVAPRSPARASTSDSTRRPLPVHIPGQSSHIAQHEQSMTGRTPFPTTPTTSPASGYPQSSAYSSSSRPDASTFTIESNNTSSVHSGSVTVFGTSTPPPLSPRFPRPHDGGPESSGFVGSAGPPPNRALPAPPPNHPKSPPPMPAAGPTSPPQSPTFSPTQTALSSGGGGSPTTVPTTTTTTTTTTATQASGVRPTAASISAQELRDLTEAYEQQSRASWGSWSGVGGGGPGVTPMRGGGWKRGSAEKKAGEKRTAIPLQELDLEKLSGCY